MYIGPIGAIALVLGWLSLYRPPIFAFQSLLVLSVFAAAAGIVFTALGSATIIPADLFVMCLTLRVWCCAAGRMYFLEALRFPSPGFWLLLATVYGVMMTIMSPLLFNGEVTVITFSRSEGGLAQESTRLFGAMSITQTIYAILALLTYAASYASLRFQTSEGIDPARSVAGAVRLLACVHVGLAMVDWACSLVHINDALKLIKDGGYIMLDHEIGGLKRITGAFPEASIFAAFTITLYAYFLARSLLRAQRGDVLLTLGLFVAGMLSLSSTAFIGLATTSAAVPMGLLLTRSAANVRRIVLHVTVTAIALVLVAAVLYLPVSELFGKQIAAFANGLLFDKMSSTSGVERTSWNLTSLRAAFDTFGLGCGFGCTIASSFAVVLVSNIGIVGTAAFLAFFVGALARGVSAPGARAGVLGRAAACAVGGMIVCQLMIATVYKILPIFYALAALCVVLGERPRHRRPHTRIDARIWLLPGLRPRAAAVLPQPLEGELP